MPALQPPLTVLGLQLCKQTHPKVCIIRQYKTQVTSYAAVLLLFNSGMMAAALCNVNVVLTRSRAPGNCCS